MDIYYAELFPDILIKSGPQIDAVVENVHTLLDGNVYIFIYISLLMTFTCFEKSQRPLQWQFLTQKPLYLKETSLDTLTINFGQFQLHFSSYVVLSESQRVSTVKSLLEIQRFRLYHPL